MADAYRIIEVKREWKDGPEDLGTKSKFWYRDPDSRTRWLFKYPHESTGQHWAEKIAERIASLLEIEHAKVDLAQFQGGRGSATESFKRGREQLFHGHQVLKKNVSGYDADLRFHQSQHTVGNIWLAIDQAFRSKRIQEAAKRRIAEYMVLDAAIGNVDRHHENWALLGAEDASGMWNGFVAPSFDHGSSLGRELRDERRENILEENRIEQYVQKGRGGIYLSKDQRHGPCPLNLVCDAAPEWPDIFSPGLAKLEKLDENSLDDLFAPIPEEWMTPSARAFAIALIRYSLERLKGLAP